MRPLTVRSDKQSERDRNAGLAECLRATYAAYIDHVDTVGKSITFSMKDGTLLLFDDGRKKSFEILLDDPDLADQFAFAYPVGAFSGPRAENEDPGRIRVEAFFQAVYGKDEAAVRKNLVRADWPAAPNRRVMFNRQANAAKSLSQVGRALFEAGGEARRIARAVGGTFNRRTVAGTKRLSAHAFGIAVDVDVRNSSYWRWARSFPAFTNNIPDNVISIFEQNGFIWGGKWYHFDTMHFEYRPEMFCAKDSASSSQAPSSPNGGPL